MAFVRTPFMRVHARLLNEIDVIVCIEKVLCCTYKTFQRGVEKLLSGLERKFSV